MKRVVVVLVWALTTAATFWIAPLSAQAASTYIAPTFFGHHLENFPSYPSICGATGSSCPAPPWGASALRLWDAGVAWCDLEPSVNQYNWTQLDAWLNTYPNADFVYTFGKPPGWALGLTGGCTTTSNNVAPSESAWKSFVSALIQHAAGRIKYFEMWNEWDAAWGGTTAQMVTFVHDAAQIIHGANQGLQVLSPSVTAYDGYYYGTCTGNCAPSGSLENLLKADPSSTGDIDIIDVHTYPTNSDNGGSWPEINVPGQQNLYQWISRVRSAMSLGHYDSYPLWSTEGSWGQNSSSFPDYSDSTNNYWAQRAYVARYALALLSAGVSRAYWYAYANPSWGTLWTSSGLTQGAVATNQVENPTNGWLPGATLTAPCSHDSSTQVLWTCDITRPNGYTGEILWVQSGSESVPAPAGYTTLRRLDGTSASISSSVSVTTEPILIEN